ncbi:DUF2884 family protein [Colwellia piezophila]|uniref:DUF2884 family protein n=1 Tax=Colwellia piezophila TaxID=211668 RepID=UPI00036FC409|nr:DUF2884 family protein [Colwellia piezophila]
MTYFHATLVASAITLSLASSAATAFESCNVELSAGFTIDANSIEFLQEKSKHDEQQVSLYKIIEGKKLFIDNKSIKLSSQQQALVQQYDEKIRHLVPQVKSVAIEGVDLAVDGINLAFNGLLGEGNSVAASLTKELELIRTQIESSLTIENGISIGVDGLENEALLGKDFEQRMDSVIEKAVINSIGSIMIAMGQQMMADDDGQSFQQRMESFGETMEQEMTTRSAQIEKKAQALCVDIAELDALEEQLKAEVEPLAHTNVFTVTVENTEKLDPNVK